MKTIRVFVQSLHIDKVYTILYYIFMTQTISIKDTRDKLADIVDKVAIGGDVFVITKFGKPRAMLVPVVNSKLTDTSVMNETFGAWSKREDIKDSSAWVSNVRAKMSIRNE